MDDAIRGQKKGWNCQGSSGVCLAEPHLQKSKQQERLPLCLLLVLAGCRRQQSSEKQK